MDLERIERKMLSIIEMADDALSYIKSSHSTIEFEDLKHFHDFKCLKEGDIIIVKWSDYTIKHQQNIDKVKSYSIVEHKKDRCEIICKLPENHYFNYSQFIKGLSGAEEVFRVIF